MKVISPNKSCQDQLWGLLSRRLGRSTDLLDAESACTLIRDELCKESLKKWINGSVFVSVLRNYRDWKQHFKDHAPSNFAALEA